MVPTPSACCRSDDRVVRRRLHAEALEPTGCADGRRVAVSPSAQREAHAHRLRHSPVPSQALPVAGGEDGGLRAVRPRRRPGRSLNDVFTAPQARAAGWPGRCAPKMLRRAHTSMARGAPTCRSKATTIPHGGLPSARLWRRLRLTTTGRATRTLRDRAPPPLEGTIEWRRRNPRPRDGARGAARTQGQGRGGRRTRRRPGRARARPSAAGRYQPRTRDGRGLAVRTRREHPQPGHHAAGAGAPGDGWPLRDHRRRAALPRRVDRRPGHHPGAGARRPGRNRRGDGTGREHPAREPQSSEEAQACNA